MGFDSVSVEVAFEICGGRCERCMKKLDYNKRGREYGDDGWEAHHKKAASKTGTDDVRNLEILCVSCHKKTSNFGWKALK